MRAEAISLSLLHFLYFYWGLFAIKAGGLTHGHRLLKVKVNESCSVINTINTVFVKAISDVFKTFIKGKVLVAHSYLTLCNPMDYSPPGSSVHVILQARTLEWVTFPFSRESSQPRERTQVSRIAGNKRNQNVTMVWTQPAAGSQSGSGWLSSPHWLAQLAP